MSALNDLPTWLLSQASHRAHGILSERLAEAGARGYEYRILEALSEGAPLSQVAIGSAARLDRRDVTVTLTALVEQGAVDRQPDPADARRNVVQITETGHARFASLAAIVAAAQTEVLAPLDQELQNSLLQALRLLQPEK